MLYRWPQGRIMRVIVLVAVLLMALDLGLHAWGQYNAWATATDRDATNLIYMGLLGGFGAIVLVYGVLAVAVLPKPAQFLIEVEQEMARVTWPSRTDLIRSTILIALLSVILAVIIAIVDLFNYWLVYTNIIGGN